MVGEDADLAGRGAGRDLAHLAAEDLALRGEDLDLEFRLAGHPGELGRGPGVLCDLVDPTLHVESALGQVVVLAVEDLAEAADGLGDRHELAAATGELLGDEERLREKAL